MKGVICYYSNTGNTLLACRYLAKRCDGTAFDLYDLARDHGLDLAKYDLVGFAAWADFLAPSALFTAFVDGLPHQSRKPAFVFASFGSFKGGTLSKMVRHVQRKGFVVLGAHALHMPENIPAMILAGRAHAQAPDEKELRRFDQFIDGLNLAIKKRRDQHDNSGVAPFRLGWSDRLMPALPRFLGRLTLGTQRVDAKRCMACGVCVAVCPSKAIALKGLPVFDRAKCSACWACYNLCPHQAIYTWKYRGVGHYPGPSAALREKLNR